MQEINMNLTSLQPTNLPDSNLKKAGSKTSSMINELKQKISSLENPIQLMSKEKEPLKTWSMITGLQERDPNKDRMSKQFLELISRSDPSGKKFMKAEQEGSPEYLDTQILKEYLEGEFEYQIVANPAGWGFPKIILDAGLSGQLGYHLLLKLPGKRLVEWSSNPSEWESNGLTVLRNAKGKVLERMWETHLTLQPNYKSWKSTKNSIEGMRNYRPGKNDCHSYVNRILIESGHPPSPADLVRCPKGTAASFIGNGLTKIYGKDPLQST